MKNLIFTLIFIFSSNFLFAKELEATFSFFASSGVTNIAKDKQNLYLATNDGFVDIFNLEKKEIISSIKIKNIKDFTNKEISAKIFSTDIIDDKILILSQGQSGGRDIFISKNGILENIISSDERLFIAYAKFLDNNKIVYALLSNQIFIYDLINKKILKSNQVSQSSFSHFVLSSDKKSIFVADESGIISEFNTSNLEKIGQFKGQNVDRVFQVDFKENTILACGQDRRASIYYKNQKKPYYKSIDFLVYAGALDDKAKKAAISLNEDNDVLVFDVDTKEELFILKGNKALITSILFLDENSLVVASDDKKVNIYNLKKD